MNTEILTRYTLDVHPSERSPAFFEWVIRDRGKLAQRCDRLQRSEAEARKRGEEQLERLIHGWQA